MKSLILIRHGKAEYANYSSDKTRKLTDEGISRSLKVAHESIPIVTSDYNWFSSTGSRAAQTAVIFSEILKLNLEKITFLDDLYTFNVDDLTKIIKEMPVEIEKIIIFGHNGALTDFVNENTSEFTPEIPTSGLVLMEFETNNWQDLSNGKVITTIFPRNL